MTDYTPGCVEVLYVANVRMGNPCADWVTFVRDAAVAKGRPPSVVVERNGSAVVIPVTLVFKSKADALVKARKLALP